MSLVHKSPFSQSSTRCLFPSFVAPRSPLRSLPLHLPARSSPMRRNSPHRHRVRVREGRDRKPHRPRHHEGAQRGQQLRVALRSQQQLAEQSHTRTTARGRQNTCPLHHDQRTKYKTRAGLHVLTRSCPTAATSGSRMTAATVLEMKFAITATCWADGRRAGGLWSRSRSWSGCASH